MTKVYVANYVDLRKDAVERVEDAREFIFCESVEDEAAPQFMSVSLFFNEAWITKIKQMVLDDMADDLEESELSDFQWQSSGIRFAPEGCRNNWSFSLYAKARGDEVATHLLAVITVQETPLEEA